MNPIVLRFADGTTFFVGLTLVFVAEALLIRFRNRIARPLLTVLTLVGLILVVISATPLSIWMCLIWMIPAVAGLVLLNREVPYRILQIVFGSVLFVATVALCIAEAPFQNAFGRAQRAMISKHGVAMLPKQHFARVLGTENGTLDGLHLSQAGHDAMAKIIAGVIQEK